MNPTHYSGQITDKSALLSEKKTARTSFTGNCRYGAHQYGKSVIEAVRQNFNCLILSLFALILICPGQLPAAGAAAEKSPGTNPVDRESIQHESGRKLDLSLPQLDSKQYADLPQRLPASKFKPKELPPEPAQDHNKNKILDLGPLRQSMLIPLAHATGPIRLEASYTEPLSLEDALRHALKYSLPIRIARESWDYQKWQFYSQLTNFLPIPSFSTGWNLTNSQIAPDQTASNARVFAVRESYPLFVGSSAFYSMLSQYYRERGWRQAYFTSINDALLDIYRAYNNLRLNNALLQIRAQSREVSQSQLKVNNALYIGGTGTQFAIMQSRTQLGADEQALLQQQVATRQAAIALAYALNAALSINLIPSQDVLSEDSIIDENISVEELFNLALRNRPELREYELFQVAAARNVQLAASALYPTAGAFTNYTHASTTTYPSTASKNNALIEKTIAYNLQKLASQARGSLTGSAASSTASSSSSSSNASAGVFGGLTNTDQGGFSMGWSLSNMGLNAVCNIVSARSLSRQAMLQANQQLLAVDQQVRYAYLNAITSRAQIDSTAYGVASAREALRLAVLRLQTGVGTNLELIQAQRDFITALTSQAQAIAASNLAQAQLTHDTGMISVETLTQGFSPGKPFKEPRLRP